MTTRFCSDVGTLLYALFPYSSKNSSSVTIFRNKGGDIILQYVILVVRMFDTLFLTSVCVSVCVHCTSACACVFVCVCVCVCVCDSTTIKLYLNYQWQILFA